ncbi:unnamed protein product [Candida verbasci]|uniref:Uncharacterized protein n=1 Tax=Candida verbasci TaxID=1227364 RepID=A0A9W4U249_9ASCO|nr:unnamed protein product [Candida verbasci]
MPTISGLLYSALLGTSARFIQTGVSGSPSKFTSKLAGYGIFISTSIGIYIFGIEPQLQHTSNLLQRRLLQLRDQRQEQIEFYDDLNKNDDRIFKPQDRGWFFRYYDSWSQPFK